jgi:hypothetical protein
MSPFGIIVPKRDNVHFAPWGTPKMNIQQRTKLFTILPIIMISMNI